MKSFNFNNIVVTERLVERKAGGRVATPKNPTGMKIRLFKDGSVYPSVDLVTKFDLEYREKDSLSAIPTNGFDIVDSRSWTQYPADGENYVFITATPKSEAKVDLFGQVRYNEDGSPVNSVLDQGSKRPELITLLREVYGLNPYPINEDGDTHDALFSNNNYVDLTVHVDVALPVGTNVFYLPKEIAKGPKKGELDYVRRENNVFHPLTVSVVEEEEEVINDSEIENNG